MVGTRIPVGTVGRPVELMKVQKLNSALKKEIEQLREDLVQKEETIFKLKQQLEKEKENAERENILRKNTIDLKF